MRRIMALTATFIFLMVVPNVRTALNRDRQKRTLADMRTIATALEARATDENTYAIGLKGRQSNGNDFAALTPVSFKESAGALAPRYIRKLPRFDGWGNEFEIRVGARSYAIRSGGSDGQFDADSYTNRTTSTFREDLVFSDGNFLQYPEGIT